MKLLFRFKKKADKIYGRIMLPKMIIERYGRDYYLEFYDDETIRLVPEIIDKDEKTDEKEN